MSDRKYKAKYKNRAVYIIFLCLQTALRLHVHALNFQMIPSDSCSLLPASLLVPDTWGTQRMVMLSPSYLGNVKMELKHPSLLLQEQVSSSGTFFFCHLFFITAIECNWKAVKQHVNLIPHHNCCRQVPFSAIAP